VGSSLARAGEVTGALSSFRWERLASLRAAEDNSDYRGRSAASTLRALRDAVQADEFVTRLRPALAAAEEALFEWLTASRTPPVLPPPPDPDPPAAARGTGTRASGASDADVLTSLTEFLRAHHDRRVVVEWRVVE
jgi:hypothetical protein